MGVMVLPGPCWCVLISVPPVGSPAVTAGGRYSTSRSSATHFDDASLPSLLLSRMRVGSGMFLSSCRWTVLASLAWAVVFFRTGRVLPDGPRLGSEPCWKGGGGDKALPARVSQCLCLPPPPRAPPSHACGDAVTKLLPSKVAPPRPPPAARSSRGGFSLRSFVPVPLVRASRTRPPHRLRYCPRAPWRWTSS